MAERKHVCTHFCAFGRTNSSDRISSDALLSQPLITWPFTHILGLSCARFQRSGFGAKRTHRACPVIINLQQLFGTDTTTIIRATTPSPAPRAVERAAAAPAAPRMKSTSRAAFRPIFVQDFECGSLGLVHFCFTARAFVWRLSHCCLWQSQPNLELVQSPLRTVSRHPTMHPPFASI